jgi:hypothetical protein
MPVNDILAVRVEATIAEQTAVNVRTFRVDNETAPVPSFADIAAHFEGIMAPIYKQLMSSAATFNGVAVRKIFPLPSLMEGISDAAAGPGERLAEALPRQTCGLITLRTLFAGRAFRGRVYVPFPGEDENELGGLPNAGYLSVLDTLGAAWIAPRTVVVGAGSIGLVSGIFHRAKVPPSPIDNTFTPVVAFTTRGGWATQTRRGSFGRPNPPSF